MRQGDMDPTEHLRQRLHRLGHAQSSRQLAPQQQQHAQEQPDPVFQLQPLTAFGSRTVLGANTNRNSGQATASHGKVYARSSTGTTLGKAAAGTQDLRAWLPLGGSKLQHRGLDTAAPGKENSSCLLALKHSSSAAANNKRLQQLKMSAMTEEKQMRTEDRFPLAVVDPNRPPVWASAHKKASSRLSHSLSMSDGQPTTAAAANKAAAKGGAGGLKGWDILRDSPLSVRQLSQEEEQPAVPRGRRSSSPPLPRAPAPTPTASPSQSSGALPEDGMDTSSSDVGAADAGDPSWEAGGGSGSEGEGTSMSTTSNSSGNAPAASMDASQGEVQWGGHPSSGGAGGSNQHAQKKRRAADALPQLGPSMHRVAAAGTTQRTKAAKARHPAAHKQTTAAQLPEGHVPLQLPSAALVHAAKMVLLEMPAQFDVSGDMGAVGRLERAGPALQEQVSLEEAAAAGAGAAAGGGAGGNHNARSAAGDLQGAKPVHLDLKGVLYDLEHLPLVGSCAVVKMGGHGGVAQVEHVFQSFVRAQPQQDPQDTAGGAYLHYDSSADEAAPPGTGAGGAEGMGVGGRGGKAARGRGGRGGGGRGRGGSKAGGGRAAGGVRKRGGGGARGHGGNKAAAGRQPQAAAAAQVAGGVSKAGGRGVQGSDSDDDYQPSK